MFIPGNPGIHYAREELGIRKSNLTKEKKDIDRQLYPVKRYRLPLTPLRKETFINALAETGSMTAAARAASGGNAKGPHYGLQTFYDEMRRDPNFAHAVELAKAEALGKVEAEIMRRAVQGYSRPVFQKGQLVGHEPVYSDNLLLRLAERLSPNDWSKREKLEHSGMLQNRQGMVMLEITPEDVLLLNHQAQHQFVGLLQQIRDAKEMIDEKPVPQISQST